jgi:hypothetical protein
MAAFLSAAILLAVGCGGDEGESPSASTPNPEATGTSVPIPPMATATPSVDPTPSPNAIPSPSPEAEAPHTAPIEPESGVESLAENTLLAVLQPQASNNLDPVALAEGTGITPPPCAALVSYVGWQVRHPYPPTDVNVEVYWERMGARELVERGPSGQVSDGCGQVQLLNNSDVSATMDIRYLFGELTD